MNVPFLDQFESQFALRRRFWKRQGARFSLERSFDDSWQMERVEISIRPMRRLSKAIFQVNAWEDRWIWLDAREGSREGWVWEWASEGRATQSVFGRCLAEKIEESFDQISHAGPEIAFHLSKIWHGSLASGPKRVSV